MTDALADRVDAIEVRLAYQDETIETLNKTVTAQWAQIDALNRKISRLTDQLQEVENRAGSQTHSEPPPPHY